MERILANPGLSNELFNGLDAESYNYLLRQCNELADLYDLPTKRRLKGAVILKKVGLENKTVEKLMTQVRKFGDKQLVGRLFDIETGNGFIAFEEMDKLTEGYTKFENGQLKYCLNRKYEKISTEEDLWRATIILAHELQRNPETGDLRGETAKIVQNDVKFIEQLANEHGKMVYDLNPDFLVMHYVREMFGNEGIKAFADLVFSREGPYWRVTGSFREYFNFFDQQFGGRSSWDFPATIMGSVRALENIRSAITEVFQDIRDAVTQSALNTIQNAIDNAIIASSEEIKIIANSRLRGSRSLFKMENKFSSANLDVVVEVGTGSISLMFIAGGSFVIPIKKLRLHIGLRQSFHLVDNSGNPRIRISDAENIVNLLRDHITTLALAIDVKFGVRGLKASIIIRRDLFDFSNRSMQLAHDRLLDLNGWIAGIHFTFGRQNIE